MFMKQIAIIFIAAACLLAASCKEEQCEPYAPQGKEISWTEYNTVNDIIEYFRCHIEPIRAHYMDTIKVKGFVAPNMISGVYDINEHWNHRNNDVTASLVHYPNKPISEQYRISLIGDYSVMSLLENYHVGQEVLVTMKIAFGFTEGCCWSIVGNVIEIKNATTEDAI